MKIRNVALVAVAAAFSAGLYGAVILTDSTRSDPRGLGAFPTASLVVRSSDEVVELACELVGLRGELWFDPDSLQLRRQESSFLENLLR